MHTTPIKSENVYLTFSDLYKKYIPAATIFFEGDIYERKENGRHKNTIIHYYRCENELHTLIIGVLPTKRGKHTLSKIRHKESRYFLR